MSSQEHVIDHYRSRFQKYGATTESVQISSESLTWRYKKLIEISIAASGSQLNGARILEIGCGLGHFYPLLRESTGVVDYTGIDIVPEFIEYATKSYPDAKFECRDIFDKPFNRDFDFVFISTVFNSPSRTDSRSFLKNMLKHSFAATRRSLAFNFISSYVNFVTPDFDYFEPGWILSEILGNLSKQVLIHHHYKNCDVAVCVCR